MKNLLFIISLLFLTNSCKTTKEGTSDTQLKLNGSFKVSSLNGKETLEKGLTFILDASTNNVSGNSGCNTYGGGYELSETTKTISFSRIFASKRYCTEKEKNDLEQTYLAMLTNSFKIILEKERIILEATDDSSKKIILIKD